VDRLPLGPVRPAVEAPLQPLWARHERAARRPLRAQAPAGDRAVGVALDLGHPLVLDEDPLAAADATVGTDGPDDPIGPGGAWLERGGPGRPRGLAEP